jgi:GNAT superfamily N-acetyltransferase
MWQPDRVVRGPRPLVESEIGPLNRLFADAFTDRYRKDGLVGVRVPQLNPDIWRYALRDAGDGALAWADERGELVAFNVAHHSGVEGWMGPLAVRPDRQGLGLGKAIIQSAIEWLVDRRVRVIGLETMPRTVENIGFYSRLGFAPGHLTITLTGDVQQRAVRGRFLRLGELASRERAAWFGRCRETLDALLPGYDFTRELELTAQLALGDTVVIGSDGAVAGFALYHSVPLADARGGDELRVLKLYAESADVFDRLIVALESCAAKLRLRRVALRCQTVYRTAYRALMQRGYRVRWTDLRMCLDGYEEPMLQRGAILFSNWEI